MSKEDVLKALQEIKRAQGYIIDVTPEAPEEASEAYDAEDRRLAAPSGGYESEPSEGEGEGEAALEESQGWDEEDEAWDQSDEA